MTVRDFLTQYDLAAYADAFEAQAVAMSDLADLTDDDLRTLMGMSSFPDRKRFKAAVASLGPGGPRRPTDPPASSGSPASGISPLSSIGSYDLYECIGEGGMGAVYRGRHRAVGIAQRQGGDVAVKVVHAHLLSKGDIAERFRREAEALALLDHPNIVKVHDVVEESGRTAIVMEWVPGRALSAVIGKETGPIPWDRAQAMVVPLLSAVAHAHSRGIVHRDLKPDNIVVMPSGEIKLLDFGIARLGESRGRTKTGTGMGTVDYMAPEQFLDAKSVDARADVYALGLTLYEMLAGRLPWDAADSEYEVMSRKKEGRIPPPTEFYPSIPPWVVSGVMAAIRSNPLERTQSVEALEASLRGEGLRARGERAAAPVAPSVAERVAPPVAPPVVTPRTPSPPSSASSGSPKVPVWIWGGGMALVVGICASLVFIVVAVFSWGDSELSSASREPTVASGDASPLGAANSVASSSPSASCAASDWYGDYELTTLVTHSANGNEGLNGFYTLALTPSSPPACEQLAFRIDKIGYGNGRIQANQVQSGSGVLRFFEADAASIGLELKSDASPIPMRFLLRRSGNGELDGIWQYTGRSWNSNGFWGILLASRAGRTVPRGPEALSAGTRALYDACEVDPASGPSCIPRDGN